MSSRPSQPTPANDWWHSATEQYVTWQREALVEPLGRELRETATALSPYLSTELGACLPSVAVDANDASSTVPQIDIPEAPLEITDDEATVALGEDARLVLGRNGQGARLRGLYLASEADGSPHPFETFLRHLLGWKGWVTGKALGHISRWKLPKPHPAARTVPEGVIAVHEVLDGALRRGALVLAQWRRDHRIYLQHHGEGAFQTQVADFLERLERRLPGWKLGAPYAVQQEDAEPGIDTFAVDLTASGPKITTWTVPLRLHWRSADGVLVDVTCRLPWGNVSLRQMSLDSPSPDQDDLATMTCFSCDGSGLRGNQQLATSPPHWMRPWYALISMFDPETLGAPKTFCSACTGSGLLKADPGEPSHWFQAERIVERSRQLSWRNRALLWAYGILGWIGTAAMISGLYRAKHVLTPTLVAIASSLGFFLAYWGLCSFYHLATHHRLRWKGTGHRPDPVP